MLTTLSSPVSELPGIGSKTAEALGRLGVADLDDLLHHYPHRYIDLSQRLKISQARAGEEVTVIGKIVEVKQPHVRSKVRILTVGIYDGTGYMTGVWFNQPYLSDIMKPERYLALSGKVAYKYGSYQIEHPFWEVFDEEDRIEEGIHTGRIIPVHPATKGITTRQLRRWVFSALQTAEQQRLVKDFLPEDLRKAHRLMGLSQALRGIHFPGDNAQLATARHRLRYDELFLLQLFLARRRMDVRSRPGIAHRVPSKTFQRYLKTLPFAPTDAQTRAIGEIEQDMVSDKPMNRLLQGDVGTGKTLVALAALLTAVDSGHQCALMAPTESLATQHYLKLHPALEELGIRCTLLTGSITAAERRPILSGLADGEIKIAFGTHALIQKEVHFKSLSLAVIDEQHRFGVRQRTALREKGTEPDVLVMTATPIPRTLALTLYGDLNVSVLDEMPPGRIPIKTRMISGDKREQAYELVRRELKKGRQGYIICPLVEGSTKIEERAVMDEIEHLQNHVFSDFKVTYLHGRMRPDEKEAALVSFSAGESDILLSTTVVEVGIDVANASVILIEGAHRFGIAQLHQLRGRVGRGEHTSFCILLNESEAPEARERLEALERTTDGFELAEIDLRIRGEGELLGTRQSGTNDLRLAALPRDMELLMKARKDAFELIKEDPELGEPEHRPLKKLVFRRFTEIIEGETRT